MKLPSCRLKWLTSPVALLNNEGHISIEYHGVTILIHFLNTEQTFRHSSGLECDASQCSLSGDSWYFHFAVVVHFLATFAAKKFSWLAEASVSMTWSS